MVQYVLRRLLQSVLVLLGVSVIVFGLLHLTGDPTRLLLPLEAREEDVRQLRHLLRPRLDYSQSPENRSDAQHPQRVQPRRQRQYQSRTRDRVRQPFVVDRAGQHIA